MGVWKDVYKSKLGPLKPTAPKMPVVRKANVASQTQANKAASAQIATNRSRNAKTATGAMVWKNIAKKRGV